MDSTQEKYADKIAKLLAKAESTTPEEAESLTAKAQELMSKWAIDEAMVEAARGIGHGSSNIVKEEFVIVGIYRFPLAELCIRILKVNDCSIVQLGGRNPRTIDGKLFRETVVYSVIGYKADIDRARFLHTSLMLQAITSENRWWDANKEEHAWKVKGGHYERRQFLFSFARETGRRLQDAKRAAENQAEKEYEGKSVALVLVGKQERVLAKRDEFFPSLRRVRHTGMRGGSHAAHAAGTAAGARADLGQTRLGENRRQIGS